MAEPKKDSILREVRRVHRDWPTFLSDSIPAVEKAALVLPDEDRAKGLMMASAFISCCRERKNGVCSFGVYLKEKRWEKLSEIGIEVRETAVAHKPFSKAWMALWFSELLKPLSMDQWPLPTIYQRREMRDADKARVIERERRQRYGWPKANSMRDRPREMVVPVDLAKLSDSFVKLHRENDAPTVAAWKVLHDHMGWPWLPLPLHEWLYFPDGEPAVAMAELRAKLSGEADAEVEDDAA